MTGRESNPMIRQPSRRPSMAIVAGLLVVAGQVAQAQEMEEADVPAAVAGIAGRNVNVNWELHESNFELWIYGNSNGSLKGHDRLNSMLVMSMEEIERTCHLTEVQKKKLLLAGHGDIKRFLDRVAEARKVFERDRFDQNKINEIYQAALPLAETIRVGLFGKNSFFHKTLMTTLNEDQANLYRQALLEKRQFRYQAKVRTALASLDDAVGFTAEQRRKLLDTILAETRPPENFNSQYDSRVVLVKIARIPEDKLKPILDDARWRILKHQLQQGLAMEPFLIQNGFVEKVGADAPPPKVKGEEHD